MFERPSDEVIRELSRALRQALGVSLFGIDIIINNQTGQHAVIDINAFPGEQHGWWPEVAAISLPPLHTWERALEREGMKEPSTGHPAPGRAGSTRPLTL